MKIFSNHRVKETLMNILGTPRTPVTGTVLRIGFGGMKEHSYAFNVILENNPNIFTIKVARFKSMPNLALTSVGDQVEFIAGKNNFVHAYSFKNHSLQKVIS